MTQSLEDIEEARSWCSRPHTWPGLLPKPLAKEVEIQYQQEPDFYANEQADEEKAAGAAAEPGKGTSYYGIVTLASNLNKSDMIG